MGAERKNRPKRLVFEGNATTINFESGKFIVEKFCCHCAGSYLDFSSFPRSLGGPCFVPMVIKAPPDSKLPTSSEWAPASDPLRTEIAAIFAIAMPIADPRNR